MSAPFFLGRIIDVIYTDPTADYGGGLTRLCLALSGVFLCGAAANAVRVYLMQTSGKGPLVLGERSPREHEGEPRGGSAPRALAFSSLLHHVQWGRWPDVGAENCFRSGALSSVFLLHEWKLSSEGKSPVCFLGGLRTKPAFSRLEVGGFFRKLPQAFAPPLAGAAWWLDSMSVSGQGVHRQVAPTAMAEPGTPGSKSVACHLANKINAQ